LLVLRGTKKFRDRVKGPVATAGDESTGALGDWFVTTLPWRPQVALAVNERTYLPVFMPLAPAKQLLNRLPSEIARILELHNVGRQFIDKELAAMAEMRIAPTNDRSVVGVMNLFAADGAHMFEGDLTTLSMKCANSPLAPLRASSGNPAAALTALVDNPKPAHHGLAEVISFPGLEPSAELVRPKPSDSADEPVAELQPGDESVYQLKISLLRTTPPIWRRVLVDGSTTLDELHFVIQAAFGWWNCHLHEFEFGDTRYGISDSGWSFGEEPVDEADVRLDEVAAQGNSFLYTYDFGDDWCHKITVEKVTPPSPAVSTPSCIAGRRAGPPEDCGGPWGYQAILDALHGRPGAPMEQLDFVGPEFDPAAFNPRYFQRSLAEVKGNSFDF
jgi:hypothetical protein